MANTVIKLKKSSEVNKAPTSLEYGEIAINYADGRIYYKNTAGQIAYVSGGDIPFNFGAVNVAGQLLIADTQGDYLTIINGDNIDLSANIFSDSFTITANLKSAFDAANQAGVISNSAFGKSNTSFTVANAAYDKANAANVLAFNTGIGANNYTNAYGLQILTDAYGYANGTVLNAARDYTNTSVGASNNYAGLMVNAANAWANTKLSNTDGALFNGSLNVKNTLYAYDVVIANSMIANISGNVNNLRVTNNVFIGGSITNVSSLIFNTSTNRTPTTPGELTWSQDDSTLHFDMDTPGNVIAHIGQDIFYLVKNQTGSTITKGTAVRFAGTLGVSGRLLVAPAIADNSVPSKYIMGVAADNIANGDDGFVITQGKLRKVDTSMFSEGDILYLSPSTSGSFQNTIPTAPNNKITMAAVITKHNNNGVIQIRVTLGSKLNEDELVELNGLANGDIITYISSKGRFENSGVLVSAFGVANSGFNKANTVASDLANTAVAANNYAGAMANSVNGAFATADSGVRLYVNTSVSSSNNYAGAMANSANVYANSTYATQTTVATNATSANNYAGVMANGAGTIANGAFAAANQAGVIANAAFNEGNVAYTAVNSAFGVINAAFGVANNAYTATNGAAAFAFANGVSTNTTAAFNHSNLTYNAVNSAFAVINVAYTSSNANYVVSNAAFAKANAALPNTTATLAGSLTTTGQITANAYVYITPAGGEEGGEIQLLASGANTNWKLDSYQNNFRVFAGSGTTVSNLTFFHATGGIVRLGVNRTDPTYTLDVAGIANTSGLYVNGVDALASGNAYANTVGTSSNTWANATFGTVINTTAAFAAANQAGVIANAAFASANTIAAYTPANAAFAAANQAGVVANNANTYGNSTYVKKAGDTITGDLVIQGNLTTSGVVTYANTQTLLIGDAIITLNNDIPAAVAPSEDAGIEVKRGSSANVSLLWREGNDNWTLTNDGTTWYSIATNTDVSSVATSANNYAGVMANSANGFASTIVAANLVTARAYTNTSTAAANNYAGAMANSSNNYAGFMVNSSNGYAETIVAANLITSRAYTNVSSNSSNNYAGVMANSSNNYAGAMANAGNAFASTIVAANLITARAYTNTSVLAANAYADTKLANTTVTLAGALTTTGSITANNLLTLTPFDGFNEGGQINLIGAGSNPNWTIDSYSTVMRIFTGGVGSRSVSLFNANGGANTVDFYVTGQVSVGGATPLDKLHVQTTGRGTDGMLLSSTTGGNLKFAANVAAGSWNGLVQTGDRVIQFSNATADTPAGLCIIPWSNNSTGLRMDHYGNVGIGSATSAYPLEIYNASAATDYYPLRLLSSAAVSGTSNTLIRIEKGNGYGGTIGGYITQGVGSGLVLGTLNGGTQLSTMWINNAGNVGIGIATPLARFHIVRPTDGTIFQANGAIGNITYGEYTGTDYLWNTGGNLVFGTYSNHVLILGTNNTERARLDTSGNFGIGATNPTTKLFIQSSSGSFTSPDNSGAASVMVYNSNTTSSSAHATVAVRVNGSSSGNAYVSYDIAGVYGWSHGIDNTDGDKFKIINNWAFNATPRLTIDSSGNVGIGTSSPATTLDVAGGIRSKTATQYNGYSLENATNVVAKIYGQTAANDGGSFELLSGGVTKILFSAGGGDNYVNNGGNFGVGTAPSYRLHVAGGASWFNNNSGDVQIRANVATFSHTVGSNFTAGSDPGDSLRNTSFITKGSTRPVIVTLRNADNTSAFWDIVADGNTNRFYFQRYNASVPVMTFDGSEKVGIATASPVTRLHVGAKVIDDASYTYDTNTLMVVHQTATGTSVLNDPKTAMMLGRQGTGGQAYGAAAQFNLSRYENNSVNSRTRLDFTLAHGSFIAANTTVMTMLSSGNVGIGNTAPLALLSVGGGSLVDSAVPVQISTASTSGYVYFGANRAGGYGALFGYDNAGTFGGVTIRNVVSAGTSGDAISFAVNNTTEAMRITGTGRVGIGTTTPGARLQLNPIGNLNAGVGVLDMSQAALVIGTTTTGIGFDSNQMEGNNTPIHINYTSGQDVTLCYGGGNVAIGLNTTTYKLQVNGSFAATTKSFVIDHPTKPGKKLRYGSLEGPENGVYIRGRLTNEHHIQFPDYWTELVDHDTITVQLTPIGKSKQPSVGDITDNGVNIIGKNIDCYYFIMAERKDVDKLVVEFDA